MRANGTASAGVCLLGVNHRVAPIELRERVAFGPHQLASALQELRGLATEACILSTCNRTEIYVVGGHEPLIKDLISFLAQCRQVSEDEIRQHSYAAFEEEAARNLFRVACGLDSMVLGEDQILGQVRDAFERASAGEAVGATLDRLFRLALEVGKRARAETRIGRGALSPSSVAVALAREALGDLAQRSVLVIGAGDAARATLRSLVDAGASRILVGNRSMQRGTEAAATVGAQAIPYVDLVEGLTRADIVISSTASSEHVITASQVRAAMEHRPRRPLLCIDIAVPRDIDPIVAEIPQVHLYNVDDLERVGASHLKSRQREVSAVQTIIDEGVDDFRAWITARELAPTIGALYQYAEEIRQRELARTLRRLNGLSDEQRDQIDVLTASIVRRLLHEPVATLKAHGEDPEAPGLAQLIRELFALEPEAELAR